MLSVKSSTQGIVIGTVTGLTVGLLVAPKSGKITRRNMRWQIQRIRARVKAQRSELQLAVDDHKPQVAASLRRSRLEAKDLASETRIRTERMWRDVRSVVTIAARDIYARVRNSSVQDDIVPFRG